MPLHSRGRFLSLQRLLFLARFFLPQFAVCSVSIPIEQIGIGRLCLSW